MRILLSSHGSGLYGAERVLIALSAELRDRGHDVVLEFPHPGPATDLATADKLPVWVSNRPKPPRDIPTGIHYLASLPRSCLRLRRYIRDGDFDVVWVNSLVNPIAAVAAKCAGVPVVWHVHERNFPGAAGILAAVAIVLFADVAAVISHYVAESFTRWWFLKRRVAILWNPLLRAPAAMPERNERTRFNVAYVGQIKPRKRVGDLVAALASLPDVTAVLVGDGPDLEGVRRFIDSNGMSGRVVLAGFQQDTDRYYRAADVVVIPSRDEPFGLIALEAMAAGTPVIAADSGALPEVLEEAALYYPVGDPTRLAERIHGLLSDPGLAVQLRNKAEVRLRAFSRSGWGSEAERLMETAVKR